MPVNTPGAVARGRRNARQKSPSKLPSVIEAIVNPASSIGPHRSVPSTARTTPQTSVIHRERRRKPAESLPPGIEPPRNSLKSTTLDAARELSETLALDMGTARMGAMTKPRKHEGLAT